MRSRHLRLDLSTRRRTFAASDVHGEFGQLRTSLDEKGFDPDQDHLVLIGDLVDRGAESLDFERWISMPCVTASLGNHDVVPRMHLDGQLCEDMVEAYGGRWFLDLDHDERRRIAALLERAPIAITCMTPGGREVGFVHGDCTKDWDDTLSLLDHDMRSRRDWAFFFALESRETIRSILEESRAAGGRPIAPDRALVSGIDHVFHGHTRVASPFSHGNRTWIDTGACYGGPMTVIDVDLWIDEIDLHTPFS